jgi:hypothetical protein
MGEIEEKQQKAAIEFALMEKRVGDLEHWKELYEKLQQEKFEKMQEENRQERIKFEEKLDKFMENLTTQITILTNKFNEQKDSWLSKPPWWLTILITVLCTITSGLVVYLVTK